MTTDSSLFEKAQWEANDMGLNEDEERAAQNQVEETGEPQQIDRGREDGAS